MSKRILVTGANGQLGSEIKELAKLSKHSFTFTDAAELDLSKEKAIVDYFKNNQFDVCINCAAYTAVDKAEEDREMAYLINAAAVNHLSIACERYDIELVHISTDFIFSGSRNTPIKEDTVPNPISVYGATKLDGEKALQNNWHKCIIIRTAWVYSSFGNNFVKTMRRLMFERDEIGVIYDQVGTPTYARDLAAVILNLVDKMNDSNYGVYHYSNEGCISWYDFAQSIKELSGLDCKVNAIPTKAYPTPAARPSYSVLDKDKIKEVFEIEVPYWKESLKECIQLL